MQGGKLCQDLDEGLPEPLEQWFELADFIVGGSTYGRFKVAADHPGSGPNHAMEALEYTGAIQRQVGTSLECARD